MTNLKILCIIILEAKMKKNILIALTIISIIIAIFGYFYIPILSLFSVKFPERNILWGISIIPTVILLNIPLFICIHFLRKNKKVKNDINTPTPLSWEETVLLMHEKQLNYNKKVLKTIYSLDKTKRFVLLKSDDGTVSYIFEQLIPFNEEELKFLNYNSLPAFWQEKNDFVHIFSDIKTAMKELKNEPEYKKYFK